MVAHSSKEIRQTDPRKLTAGQHLRALGFNVRDNGYIQLRAAIPMFAQDPAQVLSKELYPAVAKLYGFSSGNAVERDIRGSIKNAWLQRDDDVWCQYFPSSMDSYPTNKLFIATLAELLENP